MVMRVGKKLRRLASMGSSFHTGADDMEALLTTLGVLSALVMTLICSLQFTIPPEDYDQADFRNLLQQSKEFRGFAKGVWLAEGHPFIIQVGTGPSETFDIAQVLDIDHESDHGADWLAHVDLTYHHMKTMFPFSRMRVWMSYRQFDGIPASLDSDWIIQWGSAAAYFVAIAFTTSVGMYLSLLLSYVGEDSADGKLVDKENGEVPASLKAWNKLGMPCVLVSYFFLIAGIVFCAMSTHGVALARSPHSHHRQLLFYFSNVLIVLAIFMGMIAPVVSFFMSGWSSLQQRKQKGKVVAFDASDGD